MVNRFLSFLFSLFQTSKTADDPPMWLIVGLGNIGSQYKNNRHNVGFMVVDALADTQPNASWKGKFHAQIADIRLGGQKCLLMKPETLMNRSGLSVSEAVCFYKIPPEKILVIHDELDLAPGKLRFKTGGGHAGHNGLRSIDQMIGTSDYHRLRVGIGHPGRKSMVTGHVLGDFAKEDQDWLNALLNACAKRFDLIISGAEDDFLSQVAQDIAPYKPNDKKDT